MRNITPISFGHKTASFAEACTPSGFSTRPSASSTCSFINNTNMKKNILTGIIAILLLMPAYLVKASSTLSSSFNSTSISAGKKIWFTAVVKVNGAATYPLTINFTNQTITSSAFSLNVANARLILDPAATTATTVYSGSTWVTTAPPNQTGDYFISGYRDSLTANLAGGLNPISWTGTFSTCGANVSISWQWSAAVYSSFNSDMNSLGIKASDCNYCTPYSNTDNAGTSERYKSYIVAGAKVTTGGGSCGGGGSTYTATYSSYQTVSLTGTNIAASVCQGSATTLTASISGGTWTSSSSSIASVTAGGVLTGVSAGTARITYTTSGCAVTGIVTVNGSPSVDASSPASVCSGTTLSLTSSTTGGSTGGGGGCGGGGGSTGSSTFAWHGPSCFSSALQNCSRSGMTSSMAGTYSVTVTDTKGCKATATTAVAVTSTPTVGVVNGNASICVGSTTTLSNATTGGTWSTSASGIATVNSAGLVTGVSAGTATITYKVTNGCGNAKATKVVTVTGLPDAGTLSGTTSVCPGATVTVARSISGGVFSSGAPAKATVNSVGVVTGVATGTATISYAVTNSCGTATATRAITVGAAPNAGTITGVEHVCVGAATTFADAVTGGTWSAAAGGHATVSASGVVTGVSAGTATISYKVTNSCGNATATKVITVSALPDAGTITGAAVACAGATIDLANAVTGGAWSSANAAVATIDAAGVVTGIAAGTTMISYRVTSGCGNATATKMVSITSIPDAGVIGGSADICVGAAATLNNAVSGGVWSTGTAGIATVSASGVVTGIAAGTASILYTVSNSCGSAVANATIVVNGLPDAGTITAGANICVGAHATLNNTVVGGVWSSANEAVVTVDASGVVAGMAAGVASINYTINNTCGSSVANSTVNVSSVPDAGTITGGNVACMGAALNLNSSVSGGAWSTGDATVATVDAAGVVAIVGAGAATISYTVSNSCGAAVAINEVTVGSLPDAGTVSGSATVCAGATASLNNTIAGGVWSTGDASIATVDAAGVVSAVSAGAATISYTVSNSCGSAVATGSIIVNPMPVVAPVTGNASVCIGATTALGNTAAGGVWSSSNNAIASTDAAGLITGVAAGSATISYTVSNSCGSLTVTSPMAVNALPYAGVVNGIDSICVAIPTLFTNMTSGGVWSSGAASVAAVDASGLVTGLTGGPAAISYSVTNGCGTAVASRIIRIKPLPDPGVITGPSHVAYSGIIVLTDTVGVGTWTTSNPYASVAGGLVSGVYPGTVTITYSLSNLCGSAFATKLITVDSPVVFVSQITGPAFFACVGGTAAFWNGTTGGIFSINGADTAVATVVPTTGLVTGVSVGTATLSYTVWGTTVTSVLTVYPVPAAIAGPGTVCMGASMMLVDATPGGVWTSAIPSTATISPAGVVTGNNAGVVPMYYTLVAPAGCRAAINVTVNANPAGITGPSNVCPGATITLADLTPGGSWSGSNGHASVDASGRVTGISAGGIMISYTSPVTGCSAVSIIAVNPGPAPINGNRNVCTGSVTFLSDTSANPMSWNSSTPSVATISGSGAVSGISVGTATMTFTLTSGCFITTVVSVNPVPVVTAILGASSVSLAAGPVTLSDLTPGGIWSSSNTGIMTIGSATGIVTPLFGGGNSTIYYTVVNSYGCIGQAAKLITASAARYASTATTSVGAIVNMADETFGGEWSSSDDNIATVDANGIVTAVAPGNATITHIVAAKGVATETVTDVIVNALPFEVKLFPIPNKGAFTVTGIAGTDKDVNVTIEVTNMLGQVVYTSNGTATGGMINSHVSLGSNLTNGNYVLIARNGNENKTIHFVIGN